MNSDLNNWEIPDEEPEDFISESESQDEDDEPGICSNCSGSGEGMHDGTTCYICKGKGVS